MNRRVLALAALLLTAIGVLWWVREPPTEALTPSQAGAVAHLDIAYGPHERNRLDVYTPDSPGPHPTIIWFHPGGWVAGDKSMSMPIWDWTERGYAIVSVNYRYAVAGTTVGDAVDDAVAAVTMVLDRHAEWNLDADRIGVYGFSAGGHLAAMIDHRRLDVAAIAIAGAPTDFAPLLLPSVPFFDGRRGPGVVELAQRLLGCDAAPPTCAAAGTEVSPAQLAAGPTDILIVHGTADHIVPVDQATRLYDHLVDQGAAATLVLVDGGGHSPHVDEGGIGEFFDEHLLS